MLDEFPTLGRLAFFQKSLASLAGYGSRAFLITHDLSQHYGVYGLSAQRSWLSPNYFRKRAWR